MPGKTWRSVQWEHWFLTLRPVSTLGTVTVLNIPSIWAVGINATVTLWDWLGNSPSPLMKKDKDFAFRMQQTLLVPTQAYSKLPSYATNYFSSVVRALECSIPSLFRGSTRIRLEHKQSSWEHSAHWKSGNWELRESLPGDEPWGWNTHCKDRKRHRVLKDGSSHHAAYQQGAERNTETNRGLGCSLHLHQLLEQHQREAVLQRGWSSSAQPQLLPELRNAARAVGARAPIKPHLCCADTLPTDTILLQQLNFDMKTDI